jgi:hypothetical protein
MLHNFSWTTAVIIFVAYFIFDVLYAQYTINVTRGDAFRAANYGTLVYVVSAFGIINYVENYLYLIPMMIGGWIGAYISIKHSPKGTPPSTNS